MLKRLLLAGAALVFIGQANAAQFRHVVENNITYVYVSGGIEANDDNAFGDYIKNLVGQSAVFVLNSPGGNVVAGIKIGIRIREMGWVTVVPSGLTCASACGLMWLAGATRYVGRNARIGFHGAYDPRDEQPSTTGNALIGAYMRDLGMSFETIAWLTKAQSKEMEWITVETAQKYGIVAHTINK